MRTNPRFGLAACAAFMPAALAFAPAPAAAHGLSQRADLPIPAWLFGWAAAAVLVLSFAALGALWSEPKLERPPWRPLPDRIGRVVTSRAAEVLAGALGVLCLVLVVWTGLAGVDTPTDNLAPTLVYVVFWVGLVPVSVLFGDVFRALNPWRAIGRAAGALSARVAGGRLPAPLAYPDRLGHWPAAAGLLAFAWLELVHADGNLPHTLAVATLVYSALTFVAMTLFGVERWTERGEAFSVYFNLFARMSPLERRGRRLGLRRPLSGLTTLDTGSGTVAVVAVMLGMTTFDGASAGPLWSQDVAPPLLDAFRSLGLSPGDATEATWTLGLVGAVLAVHVFYRLGIAGVRSVDRTQDAERLARAFAHTLVPIALVYVGAHYLSFLVMQGQAVGYLVSDPLGHGWDLFGTAHRAIDWGVLGATTIWWLQVGLVIAGHVAGLALAHDRALVLFRTSRQASRSQLWMLAVMVGFTGLALSLLSQANA